MAKIVQVLNSMISNKKKISNVLLKHTEYFFLYNGVYKWSIRRTQDSQSYDYDVFFYPLNNVTIEDVSSVTNWDGLDFVMYQTKDIKTQEAYETFQELYQIVSEKLYGLDKIFDEIINDN